MNRDKRTIEHQYADVILNTPTKVKIGDRTYKVKPPTLSTLIKISGIISGFPQSTEAPERTPEGILRWVFTQGKNYEDIGDVLATLILGWKKYQTDEFIAEFEELSAYIEDNLIASEFDNIVAEIMNNSATSSFFQCTISLSGLNLLEVKRKITTDQSQD